MGAITCTNPVDVVKTRLQLQGDAALAGHLSHTSAATPYRGVLPSLRWVCVPVLPTQHRPSAVPRACAPHPPLWRIGAEEGMRGLQRGLCAAWLLQFTNVGTRFGGYGAPHFMTSAVSLVRDQPLHAAVAPAFAPRQWDAHEMDTAPPSRLTTRFEPQVPNAITFAILCGILGLGSNPGSYPALLASGGLSGALAGLVSCPFFLLKTRSQAQTSAPGLARAATTLRGSVAEVLREYRWGDGLHTHVAASWITGLAVVMAMQPFDFAATRMMNQQGRILVNQPSAEGGGGAVYKGPVDCVVQTVRREGPRSVYRGTLANYVALLYLRFGPYCILVFVFAEQLKQRWRTAFMTAPAAA
eukprot:gene31242-6409_t